VGGIIVSRAISALSTSKPLSYFSK